MPNTYVDRGIIKWAPFDALVGYGAMIRELKLRLNRLDKPELSDDQYDEMNQKLMIANHQDIEISVTYYEDGYFKTTYGKIKKIDTISKMIILTPFARLSISDIIDINL
ncbi:MAG: hypothetical protein A2Y45_06915 [Tenericutes bacterium GWC2_34_14]|nr:MAG: hypothetical protein A2Y45_06915 [Tenericutes bacterium GWC2_34_14]OHE33415.1 MAG: hypothetical protein A2012_02895 [Tenericutes bacterium GWE2_34_108]OHE36700.1 MAG: hypothetical protein A2Y46_08695 [Tenericutes bacterium GWF1_35_14]OHE38221.1 MAG: hypothetical protein A2Y44_09970 [Tenericutes bacterium GWF2_35_184]OHE41198.1 MAG: hypothetical protein A3K26_09865 [Tenericutes bacterium RIFOXYA12_FULL_35_10]OHE43261.1 MAG: hypothetical protein A2221_05765 [Tenericutes bacterium RIFOXYA